jgi:hygromycin-B 4-O-kinase
MVSQLAPAEFRAVLPALLDTLDAIHTADVSGSRGWGVIDAEGQGSADNWPAHLAGVADEEPGGFFGEWHRLFDQGLLERDRFERIYARMVDLFPYCPQTRWLVHGDFGFSNVLAHEGRISAVLDWANARYGDFLYDVAWLDTWAPELNLGEACRARYAGRGLPVPHFAERLECYRSYIALNALLFFAHAGDEPAYRWVCEVMT